MAFHRNLLYPATGMGYLQLTTCIKKQSSHEGQGNF